MSGVIWPAATQFLAKKCPQRWRAIGNTVSDLTGPRFELETTHCREERTIARPAGWPIFVMCFAFLPRNTFFVKENLKEHESHFISKLNKLKATPISP